MDYIFCLANEHDVHKIISLIEKRIQWMDKQNIKQWNTTHYMDCYPYEYFLEKIKNEAFYVVLQDDEIKGAVAVFKEDYRWEMNHQFFYIHHLTTDINTPGIGKILLYECEQLAIQKRKLGLRLDCQKENKRLNDYYYSLGYRYVEEIVDEEYIGNKLEKVTA